MAAGYDEQAREIIEKVVKSGLADLLNEPLTYVSWNLKVDQKKKDVSIEDESILLNGKSLKEIIYDTYDQRRIDEVIERLEALAEETETAKPEAATRGPTDESNHCNNGEVST